ncbi:N-acetylmuramoyl-L-alanine amidase family protein [Peijinzhouia sedimentorum]
MKNIVIIFFLSTALLLGTTTQAGLRAYSVKRVVIDAGHGGHDSGTLGRSSKEKDVALKIALELGRIMNEYLPDVEIIYTRKSDKFLDLKERARIANRENADLFISVHCNAAGNRSVYGTETFVMGLSKVAGNFEVAKRENAVILLEDNYEEKYEGFDPNKEESYILFNMYQKAFLRNSLSLAANVENQFATRVGRKSRGVKQGPFWVLWDTSMPSVLIETGFLSNQSEENYLNSEKGRVYIASGIFRAVRDYKNELEGTN